MLNLKETTTSTRKKMNEFNLKENRTSVLNILKEQLSNTTAHGLPNIVRSKYYLIKIVWSVVFLGSVSLCAYLIIQSISEYFQYDVNSKIRLIKEFPLKFPGIRVCNKDPFITNSSIEILANVVQSNRDQFNLANFTGNIENKLEVLNYLILNDNENDKIQKFALNKINLDFENIVNQAIDELNEIVLKCEFNMKPCPDTQQFSFDFSSGFCFNFNTDKPYSDIRNIGEFFGLELILIVGKPKAYKSLSSSLGSVVYINNQTYPDSKLNAVDILTGTETKIVYSRTFNVKQKSPYSDCAISSDDDPKKINSDYAKDILGKNFSYTQVNCLIDCIQDNYMNKCGCFNNDFDCNTCANKIMCHTNNELKCLISMNISDEIDQKCQDKCPIECDTQSISFKVTTSNYPSETEKEKLLKSSSILQNFVDNNETIEDKIVKIKIFTESFFYQYVSESPSVTLPNLLGSIGGRSLFGY